MPLLTKEQLLAKQKLNIEKVELAKGDYVYVREMTGHERDRWENSLLRITTLANGVQRIEQVNDDFRAKLAVNTVCDKEGNLIFAPEDYADLSDNISGISLAKIATVAESLNKVKLEQQESVSKNLKPGRKKDSISS